MPPKVIESAWATYRTRVIPVNASEIQLRECRRAFYAGAESLLTGMTAMFDHGTDEPTEADEAAMERVADELRAFAEDVVRGRA